MQETAAPLASVLNMPVQDLSGLNEIGAGILEGAQQNDLTGLPGVGLLRLQRDGVRELLRRRRPNDL